MRVSVVTLTKNVEEKIEDCLKSVKWVDEIVVVDSGSTDRTLEIARKYGAKIVEVKGGNYSEWRDLGAKKALGEWILYVDADERVSPELRQEIVKWLNCYIAGNSAYAIPRRNFIFGKEFKHGGQWPDYQIRFFRKLDLRGWNGELHEQPDYEGDLGYLKNPLIHIKEDNLSDMVGKTNEWSEIEAMEMLKAGHPKMNVLRFFSAGFREFWLRMVKQLAFLDRTEGVIYGIYQVYSRLISYAKLWELQIK